MIDRVTPSERTVVLIALLQATSLLGKVVQPANRKELRTRAKELTDGDWAARAVKEVIDEAAALWPAAWPSRRPARPAPEFRRAGAAASSPASRRARPALPPARRRPASRWIPTVLPRPATGPPR